MIEEQLTTQAAEIAAAGHAGWGNTMLDAAAEVVALRAAVLTLRGRLLLENPDAVTADVDCLMLPNAELAGRTLSG